MRDKLLRLITTVYVREVRVYARLLEKDGQARRTVPLRKRKSLERPLESVQSRCRLRITHASSNALIVRVVWYCTRRQKEADGNEPC